MKKPLSDKLNIRIETYARWVKIVISSSIETLYWESIYPFSSTALSLCLELVNISFICLYYSAIDISQFNF